MLKIPAFKRLLKKAFKGAGFLAGRTAEDWFYIGTPAWNLCMDFKDAPKEIKAAVMELAGELPEAGKAFTAWKNTANQYALGEDRRVIPLYYGENLQSLTGRETHIIFSHNDDRFRMMEAGDTAYILKECYLDMLNPEVDEMEGPFIPDQEHPTFVWHTSLVYLEIAPYAFRKQSDEEPRSEMKSEIDTVAHAFGLKVYEV